MAALIERPVIYLSTGDLHMVEAHARRICRQKQDERGIENEAFDVRSHFETLFVGLAGELGAAKFMGLLPEFVDPKQWWSDDGGDLRVAGKKIQVKTTRSSRKGFCVSRPQRKKSWYWDFGLLAQWSEENAAVKMIGVISQLRFRELMQWNEKGSPGFPHAGAYSVGREQMSAPIELKNYAQRMARKVIEEGGKWRE